MDRSGWIYLYEPDADAYARGVNSYIDGKSGSELSLEYAVLSLTGPDYRPEPWTPVDSIATRSRISLSALL